jgi:ribonuclease BN (tRNA processing enzyme)
LTDSAGRSLVYSGDTDFSENLTLLAKGADLFICESALPDGQKVAGHLTPSEAGKMAARAGVGTLVLTHLYPECEGVDLVGQSRKHFDGRVVVAQDLMRFPLF